MSPIETIRQIARCDHGAPFHVGEHVQWCPRCGALRYRLDRPGGELAKLEWFKASGLASLDDSLGRSGLSFHAERCLAHLAKVPSITPLAQCAARFGDALLELVFRDLVDVDADGMVSAKAAPWSHDRKAGQQ
jgi:hypothetical protein